MPKEKRVIRAEPEITGSVQDAASMGNIAHIEQLLSVGKTLQDTDEYGCTALHHACTSGKLHVVNYLLGPDKEVPINAVAGGGLTPLMCAVNNGHLAIVEKLLEHGADPLVEDEDGQTATDMAHARYHSKAAQLLDREMLKHVTTDDPFKAMTQPDMVYLKYAISNQKVSPNLARANGETLLMAGCTAAAGTRAVRYLIQHPQLDPNALNAEGWGAIHLAIKTPDCPPDTVKYLLERESLKLNVPGPQGMTPFLLAVDLDRRDLLPILCTRYLDLDVNRKDELKRRVDHIAQQNKNMDMIKFIKTLLPKGTLKLKDEEPEEENEEPEPEEE